MHFNVVTRYLSLVLVFLLRVVAHTDHKTDLENTVGKLATQLSLALLDALDDGRYILRA